jgi:hypothetical protein
MEKLEGDTVKHVSGNKYVDRFSEPQSRKDEVTINGYLHQQYAEKMVF